MPKNYINDFARKSIMRAKDRVELLISYLLCFSLITLSLYSQTIEIKQHILREYIKSFTDHYVLLSLVATLIVIIFHYQMVSKAKTEIQCRILVGDILSRIKIRYVAECLGILAVAYLIHTYLAYFLGLKIGTGLYLISVFGVYILISGRLVKA